MDKDIFLEIVSRDKAIAAQIIEEFDHGTHLILSWFCGCRWCWRDRPVDRQQILNDLACSFVVRDILTLSPVRSLIKPNQSSVDWCKKTSASPILTNPYPLRSLCQMSSPSRTSTSLTTLSFLT